VRSRAELYDWELAHLHHRVDQDVRFYRQIALATGGPVLELACGTGRVTRRLPDAVGLDHDLDMLLAARARGVARLVQGDMRRFAFEQRFSLVAIPYNSLQLLLTEDEAVDCLRAAAAHLAPGGLIAFEATDFGADADVEAEVLAEDGADGIRLIGSLQVDGGVLHYHRRFEADGAVFEDTVSLRRAGSSTAERLVREAGLRVVSADWLGLGLLVVATIPA
jgi:SAM-dependent methyltransferase